jgi:nucleotide-binding universal stress UspA family protein
MDGTKGSAAALRWALEEAQLRGVEVRAVMAWHQPVAIGASSGMSYSLGVDPAIATQFVLAAAVEAEVERSRAKLDEGFDVVVACETLEGDPGATLVRAAEGAALLVVGTRGHGGFVGAILGSVSHHVVAHATCPVVVVADPSRTRSANTESRLAGQGRAGIPPWHRSS